MFISNLFHLLKVKSRDGDGMNGRVFSRIAPVPSWLGGNFLVGVRKCFCEQLMEDIFKEIHVNGSLK